ncbi:MAG: class I SAM-dependent methyltransferase [Solirubrobacteraceae bacterium]
MNKIHNLICASDRWAHRVRDDLIPWGLEDVDLGDDVLELGPGFGATTRLLVDRVARLTVLELDEDYCRRLRDEFGARVTVTQGDATALPYPDGRFSAVICFTMLHHLDPAPLQDRAFAEVSRVLRPGGLFAGTDSLGQGQLFRFIHLGDKLALIDPERLPDRLTAAGLSQPRVDRSGRSLRFRAVRAVGAV